MISYCGILMFYALSSVLCENAFQQPVIGIVAQELSFELKDRFPEHQFYIGYSYVQAVESAGCKVVPIVPSKSEEYYRKLLNSINGVVLPGGHSTNAIGNPYYDTIKLLYDVSRQINANGTYFPILGICLGFEILLTVANEDHNILKNCSIFRKNYPLKFTTPYYTSTLFYLLSPKQASVLQNSPSTYHYHRWCLHEDDFRTAAIISREWRITSKSVTENGTEFVTSIEHMKFPFLGIQFHPEKVSFEWHEKDNVPHSQDIIIANRYFYDQLIEISKKNNHKYSSKDEENAELIYNYRYEFTIKVTDEFMCIYLFN